jgi:hypothetical protein
VSLAQWVPFAVVILAMALVILIMWLSFSQRLEELERKDRIYQSHLRSHDHVRLVPPPRQRWKFSDRDALR